MLSLLCEINISSHYSCRSILAEQQTISFVGQLLRPARLLVNTLKPYTTWPIFYGNRVWKSTFPPSLILYLFYFYYKNQLYLFYNNN